MRLDISNVVILKKTQLKNNSKKIVQLFTYDGKGKTLRKLLLFMTLNVRTVTQTYNMAHSV